MFLNMSLPFLSQMVLSFPAGCSERFFGFSYQQTSPPLWALERRHGLSVCAGKVVGWKHSSWLGAYVARGSKPCGVPTGMDGGPGSANGAG